MIHRKQKTIAGPVNITGIGIHTGKTVSMDLLPAPSGRGIVFVREGVEIKAAVENISGTSRCTAISQSGVTVNTVEHLLACCLGFGIDNLTINIDGSEVPILDGSSGPLAEIIQKAGFREQEAPVEPLIIRQTVLIREKDSFITAMPSEELSISVVVDYNHPVIGLQGFFYRNSPENFTNQLAGARTFGFREELEALLKNNQALGGSLENALVIEQDGYMNPLRYENEIVRHKCLDVLGDLAMAATEIRGHIFAYKPGHHINSIFTRELSGRKG